MSDKKPPLGFLQPALEGGTDLLLGLLGLSATEKETPANAAGQLLQAAAPVAAPLKALRAVGTAKQAGPVATKGIKAYHGSRQDFDKFSTSHIGDGEGTQITGHGLYFASHEPQAEYYKSLESPFAKVKGEPRRAASASSELPNTPEDYAAYAVAGNGDYDIEEAIRHLDNVKIYRDPNTAAKAKSIIRSGQASPMPRRMYEVEIDASPDELLDWNAPLHQQSPIVRGAVEAELSHLQQSNPPLWARIKAGNVAGKDVYQWIAGESAARGGFGVEPPRAAANALLSRGVKGTQVADRPTPPFDVRDVPAGARNYAIFDDSIVSILRKYGLLAPLAGGAVAAGGAKDALLRALSPQGQQQ